MIDAINRDAPIYHHQGKLRDYVEGREYGC